MDDRTAWRLHGLCNTEDPELFFPVGHETSATVKAQLAEARKVCANCPVLEQCREWAIPREAFGVWGGMSENEREEARRKRYGRPGPARLPRHTPREVRPARARTTAAAATR